jgi:hypothetical protein
MLDRWLLMQLERLSFEDQHQLLMSVAFELTIAARGTYAVQSLNVERPSALRGINEIQHKVIAQAKKVSNDSPRYPSDVFVQILQTTAKQYGCETELAMALSEVQNRKNST